MRFSISKIFFLLLPVSAGCMFSSCLKSTDPGLPLPVVNAIQGTGINRIELTKTIAQYVESVDTSKLHAAYFLIENIPHQYSVSYQIKDTTGLVFEFDPASFPSYESFESQWKEKGRNTGGLHYYPTKYTLDRDTITADFLIRNIENAFSTKAYRWTESYSLQSFNTSVLPYRFGNEHITNWRIDMKQDFQWLVDEMQNQPSADTVIKHIDAYVDQNFTFDKRYLRLPEPQSYTQIKQSKSGNYQDLAYLKARLLRCMGIPSTIEYVPFLADTSQAFYFAVAQNEHGQFMPLLPPNTEYLFSGNHIPKVFQRTFKKVPESLFAIKKLTLKTPPFIGHFHYVDVTDQYFDTASIMFERETTDTLFYIAVLNDHKWKAIDWKISKHKSVVFNNMVPGANYALVIMETDSLVVLNTHPQIAFNSPQ